MNEPQSAPAPSERELFFEALTKTTPTERQAFLDQACGGDAVLRNRLEQLLANHAVADGFLAAPLVAAPGGDETVVAPEGPGSVIGRYTLLEPLGEGGMGVVYRAEQQEPVRRQVALKIIKLGMDTRQVVARFEAERQALALMDHPNIAKVLDGGMTGEGKSEVRSPKSEPPHPASGIRYPASGVSAGRPYFVMELVEGVPITQFCEQSGLSVEQRLRLFIQVSQAVQHAHQKGIIHRDLKPSNVMVTLQDGVPVPKVIDFGVAKAINQQLTEKTLFTQHATLIGTPAYMSPEQAELSGLDVDTRSDIYGLGVLLYELLTGTQPFPEQRLRNVAYAEMQRIILHEEPERPSTRLRRTAAIAAPPPPATDDRSLATRHAPLNTDHRSLATDLDWIVLKCLEKDRHRRYETANGLVMDLERHLHDEPVLARPPSARYRLGKFARRHSVPLASATVVLVALLAAVAISTSQAVRARRAEAVAREETVKSTALAEEARRQATIAQNTKEFLFDNLLGVRADETAQDQNAEEYDASRLLLQKAARKLEGKFTNDPATEAEVRMKLAAGFAALRDFAPMKTQAARGLALNRSLYGAAHSNTFAAIEQLAWAQFQTGERAAALQLLTNALALARPAPGQLREGGYFVLATYAYLLGLEGDPAGAIRYTEESIAQVMSAFGPGHRFTRALQSQLATLLEWNGTAEAAERLWRQILAGYEHTHGRTNQLALGTRFALARNLVNRGQPEQLEEGLPMLEEVVALNLQQIGPTQWFTLDSQYWLGRAYEARGQAASTVKLYDCLLPLIVPHLPSEASQFCSIGIADFFVRQRDHPRAAAAFRFIHERLSGFPPNGSWSFERRNVKKLCMGGGERRVQIGGEIGFKLRPSFPRRLRRRRLRSPCQVARRR